jgi:hypothetical protein
MASRITYNSKNIDFTNDAYEFEIDQRRSVLTNMSASKLVETLNVGPDEIITIRFRNLLNSNAADATLKRNLRQWFMWALAGNSWTFARDSAEAVNTTLDVGESAGDTVIDVASTTGIDVNGLYVIRSATHMETVKIDSIDAGAGQVTITETLNFDYANGSRFRSAEYWPARLVESRNPIIENPPMFYDVELIFMEDVNDL